MKHLILHIGTYKTGTTSIQKSLFHNRKKLKEVYDVDYLAPENGCSIFGQQVFHRNLSKLELISVFTKSKSKTHIISDECLWNNRLRNKKYIFEAIKEFYEKITVVCYLRRQDYFIESFYKQELKTGMSYVQKMTISDFITHLDKTKSLNYFDILSDIEETIGSNMIVRVFDRKHLINSNVVEDFYSLIKVDSEKFEKVEDVNHSYSDFQAILASTFYMVGNYLEKEGYHEPANRKIINEVVLRVSGNYYETSSSVLSNETRKNLINRYAALNSKLCAKFKVPNHISLTSLDYKHTNTSIEDYLDTLKPAVLKNDK